MMFHIDLW